VADRATEIVRAKCQENDRSGGTIIPAMADHDASDQDALLSPSERARHRARDRKRTTRMVVDNAGVKRILQARRDRAHAPASRKGSEAPATSAGGRRAGGQ
jgi:hypothetical protein